MITTAPTSAGMTNPPEISEPTNESASSKGVRCSAIHSTGRASASSRPRGQDPGRERERRRTSWPQQERGSRGRGRTRKNAAGCQAGSLVPRSSPRAARLGLESGNRRMRRAALRRRPRRRTAGASRSVALTGSTFPRAPSRETQCAATRLQDSDSCHFSSFFSSHSASVAAVAFVGVALPHAAGIADTEPRRGKGSRPRDRSPQPAPPHGQEPAQSGVATGLALTIALERRLRRRNRARRRSRTSSARPRCSPISTTAWLSGAPITRGRSRSKGSR